MFHIFYVIFQSCVFYWDFKNSSTRIVSAHTSVHTPYPYLWSILPPTRHSFLWHRSFDNVYHLNCILQVKISNIDLLYCIFPTLSIHWSLTSSPFLTITVFDTSSKNFTPNAHIKRLNDIWKFQLIHCQGSSSFNDVSYVQKSSGSL